MAAAFQDSLFSPAPSAAHADVPTLAPLPGFIHRRSLDERSWVDVRPEWVSGADELYRHLAATVAWQHRKRVMYDQTLNVPRLERFFDTGEPLPHPILEAARSDLSDYYAPILGEPFTSAGMCWYRTSQDSVAWHGDLEGRSRTVDTVVAILVLGDARPLTFRPRGGGPAIRFTPGHGDLLTMGGACQREWEHAVPKVDFSCTGRISVQFRVAGIR